MALSSRSEKADSSDATQLSAKSAGEHDRPVRSILPDQDVLSSRERLGDFRLIRQIGHGGMGVVYEAEQLSLARKVAVKVLPFASMLNLQHRKRFQNEARAAATLDHPNIVPIYFVGEERGVHFYAMHLIEGQSIADLIVEMRGGETEQPNADNPTIEIDDGRHHEQTRHEVRSNISTRRSTQGDEYHLTVARLGAEAAEALDHAHQIGILHRDIKPGNLMIDRTGKLWITDFGLASIEHGESLTRTGGVVGTAAYMSPEQASDAHHVDNRTDIYSLGATLYEMLTLRKHRSDDITRLEADATLTLDVISVGYGMAKVPADLETIIFKALSVDPDDRYHTALEMASDLRAFIDGREIKARRLSITQRLSRWMRRHRRLTTAGTAISFLLIGGFGTIMWLYSRQLSDHAVQLEEALADARGSRILAEEQLDRAEQSESSARRSEQLAKDSELFALRMSYRSDMQRAYESFERKKLADATRLLAKQIPSAGESDLRGVEWKLLKAEVAASSTTLGTHDGPATECVLFPDGKTVATAGKDGLVQVWDVDARQIRATFEPKVGSIHAMAISPDGQTLAIAGAVSAVTLGTSTVHLLDATTGRRKSMSQNHRTTIESLTFSPNGERIASASRYKYAKVSTVAGEHLHTFAAESRNDSLAFSPDGNYLATRLDTQKIRIWDCQTGDVTTDVRCSDRVDSICWSPRGDYIVTAGTNSEDVDLIDTQTFERFAALAMPDPQPVGITTLNIFNDGKIVVAGDFEGQIHQWEIAVDRLKMQANDSGKRVKLNSIGQPFSVESVSAHGVVRLDDGRLISVHENGSVQLLVPNTQVARMHSIDFSVSAAAISPDTAENRATLYLGSTDGSVHRFDIDTGRSVQILEPSDSGVGDLAFSKDGSKMVVAYETRRVELIDTKTYTSEWTHSNSYVDPDPMFRVAISSDGRFIGRTGNDLNLAIWDTSQRKSVFVRKYSGIGWSIAFAPDGSMLAHGRSNANLYSIPSGKSLHTFANVTVNAIQFSPDGQRTVSAHDDGSIRLFDLNTGTEQIMRGHTSETRSVVFDDRARTLLSADIGGKRDTLRLWDVETGEAYGSIVNPLPNDKIAGGSACKVFVVSDRVILCNVATSESIVAVWDLQL